MFYFFFQLTIPRYSDEPSSNEYLRYPEYGVKIQFPSENFLEKRLIPGPGWKIYMIILETVVTSDNKEASKDH